MATFSRKASHSHGQPAHSQAEDNRDVVVAAKVSAGDGHGNGFYGLLVLDVTLTPVDHPESPLRELPDFVPVMTDVLGLLQADEEDEDADVQQHHALPFVSPQISLPPPKFVP